MKRFTKKILLAVITLGLLLPLISDSIMAQENNEKINAEVSQAEKQNNAKLVIDSYDKKTITIYEEDKKNLTATYSGFGWKNVSSNSDNKMRAVPIYNVFNFAGSDTKSVIRWVSSDPSVVTVKNGVIEGIKEGKAKISITIETPITYQGYPAVSIANETTYCNVEVKNRYPKTIAFVVKDKPITELTLAYDTVFTPKLLIGDAFDKTYTLKSSNEKVFKFNNPNDIRFGQYTGAGVTTITVTGKGKKPATASFKLTVTNAPEKKATEACSITGVKLSSAEKVSLKVGEKHQIEATATTSGNGPCYIEIIYSSSNKNVATVDKNGKVTAVGKGSASIEISISGKKKTVAVTVTEPASTPAKVNVSGVTLKTMTSINVGASEKLTATVAPSNATNKAVTWKSSDTSIATVSDGTVKGVKEGTVTITVITVDGEKRASCIVTVKKVIAVINASKVTLNKTNLNLNVGSSEKLTATVEPYTATYKEVTWKSSNPSIATVTDGTVKALKAGSAVITATSLDGTKSTSCNVTVTEIKYTVKFHLNGGGSPQPANQTVVSGAKATKPANPTRSGYKFGGWFKEAGCSNAWDFATAVKNDMYVYAKWTAKKDKECDIDYTRPVTTNTNFLSWGSNGESVKWLQAALNKADSASLDVDGQFGNLTQTAVKNFQRKYGLVIDGSAGPKTIGKLVDLLK